MSAPKTPKTHTHYWQYPWVQIQGKTPNETVVVRYCRDCGEKQMAVARNWRKATGDYARSVAFHRRD